MIASVRGGKQEEQTETLPEGGDTAIATQPATAAIAGTRPASKPATSRPTERANRIRKTTDGEIASGLVSKLRDIPAEFQHKTILAFGDGIGRTWDDPNYMKFYNDGYVTFPFLSDGMWFMTQHRRWGLLKEEPNYLEIAKKVNQIELYREAAAAAKVPLPKEPMRTSRLMDGVTWDGKDPAKYAGAFKVKVA